MMWCDAIHRLYMNIDPSPLLTSSESLIHTRVVLRLMGEVAGIIVSSPAAPPPWSGHARGGGGASHADAHVHVAAGGVGRVGSAAAGSALALQGGARGSSLQIRGFGQSWKGKGERSVHSEEKQNVGYLWKVY